MEDYVYSGRLDASCCLCLLKVNLNLSILTWFIFFIISEIIENTESVGNEKILLSEIDKLEHSVK